MDFNTEDNRKELIGLFPGLNDDTFFKITSEDTAKYNCIAWAMGFENRWVQCMAHTELNVSVPRFFWWPEGVSTDAGCQSLIDAFIALGFEQTIDSGYENGYDKAVLYTDDGVHWTHASRIISDDVEHSKFGDLWDAEHGRNCFEHSPYGVPYAYMRRQHALKQHFLDLHPVKYGTVTINEENLNAALSILKFHFYSK